MTVRYRDNSFMTVIRGRLSSTREARENMTHINRENIIVSVIKKFYSRRRRGASGVRAAISALLNNIIHYGI